MGRVQKRKIKPILLTVGTIIAFVLLIVIILNASVFYNDLVLNSFSEQLYNCNLPDKTVIVEKHEICGKLNGNGDGMDFLACILIKSDKTMEELEEHFKALEFEGAKSSHTLQFFYKYCFTAWYLRLLGTQMTNDFIIFKNQMKLYRLFIVQHTK